MRTATALALAAAALGTVQPSYAHGDPGSEYLRVRQAFLSKDAKLSTDEQQRLLAIVAGANRGGYAIRVALIWKRSDLGPHTEFWRAPRSYARYLSDELGDVYKQRVLVVMPNGFGFSRLHHSTEAEYAVLRPIAVAPGGAGLAEAATTAVRRLAAAHGVTLVPARVAANDDRTARDRELIVLATLGAIAIAMLIRLARRRTRR